MISRAKLRGKKLDEDCKKFANSVIEADLRVCHGLLANDKDFLPKCQKCKAFLLNAKELIVKRMKEAK